MNRVAVTVILMSLFFGLPCAWSADSPGDDAIREAITILEARKAQAEKKGDIDKIAKAISDLEKLLPQAKKGVVDPKADPDLAKLITPALLKKKFAGKATFNPKTNELTIVYDFAAKDQLKDFDLGDAKPSLTKGILTLEPGESVQHVVKFGTLKLTGTFSAGKLMGDHIGTTGGVRVVGGGTLVTGIEGKYAESGFNATQTPTSFEFVVAEKRVAVGFGTMKGGVAVDGLTLGGNIKLSGGAGGNKFSKLVLSGIVNEEWAKEFFKE